MFGEGYATAHPEVVSGVMLSASIDRAASVIAGALAVEDEPATAAHTNGGLGPSLASLIPDGWAERPPFVRRGGRGCQAARAAHALIRSVPTSGAGPAEGHSVGSATAHPRRDIFWTAPASRRTN